MASVMGGMEENMSVEALPMEDIKNQYIANM
jgi:hypothetical protein